MLQHVTDPETCIQCSACEMACPVNAISCLTGRYCIDAQVCNECLKCVDECPTGAANAHLTVDTPFSIDEQASWAVLPASPVAAE